MRGNVAAAWSRSTAVLLPPLMSALLSALLRDACACLILKTASVSLDQVQRCGRGVVVVNRPEPPTRSGTGQAELTSSGLWDAAT